MRFKNCIFGIALFMAFLIISLPICFAQEMSLTYDANGNLVSGDGKYRTYNSLNQLYRVYNGSGTNGTLLYEFKYHPVEERVLVKKTYNSTGGLAETVYYWSQNFITVVNASGSYNFTYVYHNGELVAQQNPDGSKLFVSGDNKGSTSVITNSSGSILERTTYSPFGEVLSGGRLNRYGYESKEQELGFGKVPVAGLVSYYAFEGGAYDDGKGNQGTVANATLTTGKVRDGYAFNGNGSYIAINDSSSLDITGNLTLSAWVNPAENQAGYVVAKYGAYMIHLTGSPFTAQGGIWYGGGWHAFVSYNISLNTWTHIVFTYDRVTAKLYMNGVSVANFSNTSAIDTNNQVLCIGAKNATTRDRDINASIDEVGVWNRALTSDEVTQLYNYGNQFDSGFRSTDFEARRLSTTLGPFFEQPDTVISNVYEPQALNRYMFEAGNPLKNKDETGHCPWCVAASLGFFIGSVNYMMTHEGSGWSNVLNTYEAGVGGALVGVGLISGNPWIAGLLAAGNAAIRRHLNGESLDDLDALADIAGSGLFAAGATKLTNALLPAALGRPITNPWSLFTTKTGQYGITKGFVSNAFSTIGTAGMNWLINQFSGTSSAADISTTTTTYSLNYKSSGKSIGTGFSGSDLTSLSQGNVVQKGGSSYGLATINNQPKLLIVTPKN